MKSSYFIPLLFCAAAVVGQTRVAPQPGPDTAPPKKPGTVQGVVTNSVTKLPVKKATVTLRSLQQRFEYMAITDAQGQFSFENVEPGRYQVSAVRDAFTPAPARRSMSPFIRVAEEEHVKDIAIQLVPAGAISGKALDEDGEPIVGAIIQAMQYVYQQGTRMLMPSGTASTNDKGEYRIHDVRPGRYYVRFSRRANPPAVSGRVHFDGPEVGYPATFFPNSPAASQATQVTVEPGAEVGSVDFRPKPAPVYHVRGKVTDGRTGQPLTNANVQIGRCDGQSIFDSASTVFARIEPNGNYDAYNIFPGTYCAVAEYRDRQNQLFARRDIRVTDQSVGGIDLTLQAAFEVHGTVQVDGPPPTGLQLERTRIGLRVLDSMVGGAVSGTVHDDGTFSLNDVAPRQWTLAAYGLTPSVYIKSIRFGDDDAPGGQLDFSHGPVPITITLGTDPAQLDGSVQDGNGNPAQGAAITLVPDGVTRADLFKSATTDANGVFHISGVAPGRYRAFACEEFDSAMQVPEMTRILGSKGVAFSIDGAARQSIQLNLITSAELAEAKEKLP